MAVVYGQFALASQFSTIEKITPGPDGNVWFTEEEAVYMPALGKAVLVGAIGTFNTTTHAIAEYPIGNNNTASAPIGITTGPDGNLWFADSGLGAIGTINPTTHAIVEYPVGRAGSTPTGIATGPDGNLWFTDPGLGAIGTINPTTHAVAAYPTNMLNANPEAIVSGPGGLLWFTESHAIGTVDPTTHAMVDTPVANGHVTLGVYPAITVGPDGNVWFTAYENLGASRPPLTYFGEIDAMTRAVSIYPASTVSGPDFLSSITVGPDGNIWSSVTEINPTTHVIVTNQIVPYAASSDLLQGIAKGPDNKFYYTGTGAIGQARVVPQTEAVINSNVNFDSTSDGTDLGGPVAGRTVYLDLRGDGRLDPGDPTAVTDATGYYLFTGLAPGSYTVRAVTYPGDVVTNPAGGGSTIMAVGGQSSNPPTIGIVLTSAVLPIAPSVSPFGASNPDVSTAEVNGLYRLILGRAPDATGGANAVAYLKGGGSLAALASGLFHSTEYETLAVQADFRNYLGRSGSSSDIAAGVAALKAGATEKDLAGFFFSTPEFSQLHASNADFATAAYQDILGRTPSSSELALVTGLLAGSLSRQGLTSFMLGSQEAALRAVNGFYSTFLARQGDPAGIAFWVADLQGGASLVDVAAAFAPAPDYVARANKTVH
jgi:streptogramin lyase